MRAEPKKKIFLASLFDEIKDQHAHGSYMLPWPGIQCNFDCEVDEELNLANVKPMAERLLEFLKSEDDLMPFNAPYLPGESYLTRWGAQHVWAVMPGWGKTRARAKSTEVELADATSGRLIDGATGLPVVIRKVN